MTARPEPGAVLYAWVASNARWEPLATGDRATVEGVAKSARERGAAVYVAVRGPGEPAPTLSPFGRTGA